MIHSHIQSSNRILIFFQHQNLQFQILQKLNTQILEQPQSIQKVKKDNSYTYSVKKPQSQIPIIRLVVPLLNFNRLRSRTIILTKQNFSLRHGTHLEHGELEKQIRQERKINVQQLQDKLKDIFKNLLTEDKKQKQLILQSLEKDTSYLVEEKSLQYMNFHIAISFERLEQLKQSKGTLNLQQFNDEGDSEHTVNKIECDKKQELKVSIKGFMKNYIQIVQEELWKRNHTN